MMKHEFERARPLLVRALAIREKVFGGEHREVGQSVVNLGSLALAQEDFAEAKRLFVRALAIEEKALGPDHQEVGARAAWARPRRAASSASSAEAQALAERSLAIDEKALGPDHPDVAQALACLAEVLLARAATRRGAAAGRAGGRHRRGARGHGHRRTGGAVRPGPGAGGDPRRPSAGPVAAAEQAREGLRAAGMVKELEATWRPGWPARAVAGDSGPRVCRRGGPPAGRSSHPHASVKSNPPRRSSR
jgi:hypothetical protein